MNKQLIYNDVRKHLLKQNEKSMNKDGTECYYKNSKGLRCAIGCLIPSKNYSSDLEGRPVVSEAILNVIHPKYEVELSLIFSDDNASFLCALQAIHDVDRTNEWEAKLNELATKWSLKIEDE